MQTFRPDWIRTDPIYTSFSIKTTTTTATTTKPSWYFCIDIRQIEISTRPNGVHFFVFYRLEIIVWKGENAGYLFFFQKPSPFGSEITGIVS